jgi:hypothetical protein
VTKCAKRSADIHLGPHEDIFRTMILNGEPGHSVAFPCILSSYRKHNDLSHRIV